MIRIKPLDTLRFMAAFMVFIFHLHKMPVANFDFGFLNSFIKFFGSGVTLFFILSAFSLAYTNSNTPIFQFYKKRVFRIAPLFYFVLIVTLVAQKIIGNDLPSFKEIILNLTFLFNLETQFQESIVFAGWTIGVEMLFYLLFPWFNKLSSFKLAVIVIFITLLNSLENYFEKTEIFDLYLRQINGKSFLYHLPIFLLGILTYRIYQSHLLRKSSTLLTLLIIGVVLSMQFGFVENTNSFNYLFQGLFYSLLSLIFIVYDINTAYSNKLGTWSYSIYLWHPLVIASFSILLDDLGFQFKIILITITLFIISRFSERHIETFTYRKLKQMFL